MQGRILLEFKSINGVERNNLDISKLDNGTYYLKIHIGEKEYNKKIIISN